MGSYKLNIPIVFFAYLTYFWSETQFLNFSLPKYSGFCLCYKEKANVTSNKVISNFLKIFILV